MAHTVEQLAQSFHKALKEQPGPGGRKKVCELLQEALKDQAFIAATFSDSTTRNSASASSRTTTRAPRKAPRTTTGLRGRSTARCRARRKLNGW